LCGVMPLGVHEWWGVGCDPWLRIGHCLLVSFVCVCCWLVAVCGTVRSEFCLFLLCHPCSQLTLPARRFFDINSSDTALCSGCEQVCGQVSLQPPRLWLRCFGPGCALFWLVVPCSGLAVPCSGLAVPCSGWLCPVLVGCGLFWPGCALSSGLVVRLALAGCVVVLCMVLAWFCPVLVGSGWLCRALAWLCRTLTSESVPYSDIQIRVRIGRPNPCQNLTPKSVSGLTPESGSGSDIQIRVRF
jgi:hypothetical protein